MAESQSTARIFAESIILGPGGMDAFEHHEVAVWHTGSDRVAAAMWTLRCLANPDCEGSEAALAAILSQREQLKAAAG